MTDEQTDPNLIRSRWKELVERPAREAHLTVPHLRVVRSPYRQLINPLLRVIRDLAEHQPMRTVAVIVPERVEPRWYQMWLHDQRATAIEIALLMKGGPRVAVINTPWYVSEPHEQSQAPSPSSRRDQPRDHDLTGIGRD